MKKIYASEVKREPCAAVVAVAVPERLATELKRRAADDDTTVSSLVRGVLERWVTAGREDGEYVHDVAQVVREFWRRHGRLVLAAIRKDVKTDRRRRVAPHAALSRA